MKNCRSILSSTWLFSFAATLIMLSAIQPPARADSIITEYTIPTAGGPHSITPGPDGNLWFTGLSGGIGRITPAGTITTFAAPASSGPENITAGPDGNLWFTERYVNKIGRITPDGAVAEFPIPTASCRPAGISAGPDGNVWFTEFDGGKIGRITPPGNITEFTIPTAKSSPYGITTGPDGNLWFAEYYGKNIGRITPAGVITEFRVPATVLTPFLITAGPDGNLWFTDYSGNQIGRMTLTGTATAFAIPTINNSGPYGITTGPDGSLWFSEYLNNKVGRITPDGIFTELGIPTSVSGPVGITAGPDGNLWFLESLSNKIGELTPMAAEASAFRFSATNYRVAENDPSLGITITIRRADSSHAATVDFSTVDHTDPIPCNENSTGTALSRCDYVTTVDTLTFAVGETTKTITIPIINDVHVEGDESFQIALSYSAGANLGAPSMVTTTATITIIDDDTTPAVANPINDNPFFVRMQYLDFLSREPDADGLNAWLKVLNNCSDANNSPNCDRIEVSASFFRSQEFQFKGYFVYLFYKVSLNHLPQYAEIIPEMRRVAGQTANEVIAQKRAFTEAWVQRPDFKREFDGLTNIGFVNKLMSRYDVTAITTPVNSDDPHSAFVRVTGDELASDLNAQPPRRTRAQVLRAFIESKEADAVEYNGAFVAMQYYGYLRRTPEFGGYFNWLRVINQYPRDDKQGYRVMVNGFMNSDEYRQRFGLPR